MADAVRATTWATVLGALTEGRDLSAEQARWAMAQVMEGLATDAQIAGLGIALKMKGVSGPELRVLADTMLSYSRAVDAGGDCLDIVGTGGDRYGTVNISTMSAVVVSACGRRVVKHGGRASSSKSGGADVLEALGVAIDLGPREVEQCVRRIGLAFCFAPVFHPAMRHAAAPRRELGVPTVFNVLGPLTNPAAPGAGLIGCAFEPLVEVMAEVFALRGRDALVVRGHDGLDEVTITGPTRVLRVHDGEIRPDVVEPGMLGIAVGGIEQLRGGDGAENARIARAVFAGETGPVRDAVVLNSAAAVVAADRPGPGVDLTTALRDARDEVVAALDSGAAARRLAEWAEVSSALR